MFACEDSGGGPAREVAFQPCQIESFRHSSVDGAPREPGASAHLSPEGNPNGAAEGEAGVARQSSPNLVH